MSKRGIHKILYEQTWDPQNFFPVLIRGRRDFSQLNYIAYIGQCDTFSLFIGQIKTIYRSLAKLIWLKVILATKQFLMYQSGL